jgi:hypothetical protein
MEDGGSQTDRASVKPFGNSLMQHIPMASSEIALFIKKKKSKAGFQLPSSIITICTQRLQFGSEIPKLFGGESTVQAECL